MHRSLDPGIRLIAFFELVKGTLVAIGVLGLLTLIHKDVGDVLNEAVLSDSALIPTTGTCTRLLHGCPERRRASSRPSAQDHCSTRRCGTSKGSA